MSDFRIPRIKPGDSIGDGLTVLNRIAGSADPVVLVWNHADWCPMVCKMFGSPRRARREATALTSLAHPNIVRSFGYRQPSYTLMEYLEGPSLTALIDRQPQGRLTVSNAIRVAIHVGAALHHMHGKGLLHMDVKPDNVIVVHGRPVLFDFGSIRLMAEPRPQRVDGTAPYIAPEELRMQETGPAADVFSLGVTLYQMLTGELPFPDVKIGGLPSQATKPPQSLRRYRPRVSGELDALVMRCLAQAPADRPSLPKLLPALHALIEDGPAMWPEGLDTRPEAKPRRRIALPASDIGPAEPPGAYGTVAR
jgi:serine/threonine protein kinase